jgi:IstB-like ATP binding protein
VQHRQRHDFRILERALTEVQSTEWRRRMAPHVAGGWRRARDSNPQGACAPVDFKSTALPVEASPPSPTATRLYCTSPLAAGAPCDAMCDFSWCARAVGLGDFRAEVVGREMRTPSGCVWTGVGKSHIAQALAHEACRRGYEVLFINTAKMPEDLGSAASVYRVSSATTNLSPMTSLRGHDRGQNACACLARLDEGSAVR